MKSALCLGVLAVAGTAHAAPVLTFTFSDLVAAFDDDAGSFVVNEGALTSGDVTRTLGPIGTADYPKGFSTFGTAAGVTIDLSIGPIGVNTADATGTIRFADPTGDTITGNVDGTFIFNGGFVFFNGALDTVVFGPSADGVFDGFDLAGFDSSDFEPSNPLSGSIVQLFFEGSGFFAESFTNRSVQASGVLIPSPGALGVLAAGGVLAIRRRR
jgi:hypothetical protein